MSAPFSQFVVNHFPVVGASLAAVSLIWALWHEAKEAASFGLICLVLLGLFAGTSYFSDRSGPAAVNSIPAVSSPLIENHEGWAFFAYIMLGTVVLAVLMGMVLRGARASTWSISADRPPHWLRLG